MTITEFRMPLFAALAFSALTLHAMAEDRRDILPGVEGTVGLAGPGPEPEATAVAEDSPYGEGFVRIPGTDTYVKISGLVRYDIDFAGRNNKADAIGR